MYFVFIVQPNVIDIQMPTFFTTRWLGRNRGDKFLLVFVPLFLMATDKQLQSDWLYRITYRHSCPPFWYFFVPPFRSRLMHKSSAVGHYRDTNASLVDQSRLLHGMTAAVCVCSLGASKWTLNAVAIDMVWSRPLWMIKEETRP